jgi:hypothetical protein
MSLKINKKETLQRIIFEYCEHVRHYRTRLLPHLFTLAIKQYIALNVHVCPGEQKEFLLQKLKTYIICFSGALRHIRVMFM